MGSGLLMTGQEVGAAHGVAALTAIAADTSPPRAGIVTGSHDSLVAISIARRPAGPRCHPPPRMTRRALHRQGTATDPVGFPGATPRLRAGV